MKVLSKNIRNAFIVLIMCVPLSIVLADDDDSDSDGDGDTNVTVINDETDPVPVTAIDDYVSVRMTGEFADPSCCLTDTTTTFIPRLDVGQFGGRDLLVEYVSCQALIPATQPVNLYIGLNGQDAPVDALIAIKLTEQYRALSSDSLFHPTFHASHAVKVLVDSGDDLLLNGRRPVGSTGVGRVSCVVAGRLVN